MNAARITGIVLIVLGLAGFFTGGFSFTKDTTAAKLGPIQLTVKEKESVNIPQWLSLGAVVLGAAGLALPDRRRRPLEGRTGYTQ
jgi:drug/metabolite transporter (DMT)-like permease